MLNIIDKALLKASKYLPFSHQRKWRIGIRDEVAFWDGYIGKNYVLVNGVPASAEGRERSDPARPLQPEFVELIEHIPDHDLRILDVGSGPFSRMGRAMAGRRIELTAVDPLAEEYATICRKHGVSPPETVQLCQRERVAERFPRDHFHLVHANNCLDHSYDPVRAIDSMLEVLRPGCHMYLRHQVNVADSAGWVGLHQWNFRMEDGRFMITDRNSAVDMVEHLKGRATVRTHRDKLFMVNVIRKH